MEYVFGGNKHETKPYCQHVLHAENLKHEFADLMAKYDMPLKVLPHSNQKSCHLASSDISPDAYDLIKRHYAEDYEAFGYQP